jgi:hypothetical protein
MDANQKDVQTWLEELAKITDVVEQTFISKNCRIVVELNESEFRQLQKNFREIDNQNNEMVICYTENVPKGKNAIN